MKYYSEMTKKLYDSEDALVTAETAATEAEAKAKAEKERVAIERKVRADEIEKARAAMVAAQKEYRDKLEAFCKDYGTYHTTIKSPRDIPTLFDFFDFL